MHPDMLSYSDVFVSHNEMSGIPVGLGIISLFSQEFNMQINQNKGIFFMECATRSLLLSLRTLKIWTKICSLVLHENIHSCRKLRRKLKL